jgi:hypothetical protein
VITRVILGTSWEPSAAPRPTVTSASDNPPDGVLTVHLECGHDVVPPPYAAVVLSGGYKSHWGCPTCTTSVLLPVPVPVS